MLYFDDVDNITKYEYNEYEKKRNGKCRRVDTRTIEPSPCAPIKDLIDAIKEDREPMVNVYEGKKPVDIILAAYESSKTGKKVLLY